MHVGRLKINSDRPQVTTTVVSKQRLDCCHLHISCLFYYFIAIIYLNMALINGRALHFVFKVPDRALTARFYREILGMKVLRHEEFADGCEATCNG